MTFEDHFSGHARTYAAYRPRYPAELFNHLHAVAPDGGTAWDAATGNGQAATALAAAGRVVFATDASVEQIRRAEPHPSVLYAVALSEAPPLPDRSVSLVTVAQALHWFDAEEFYHEVHRVLVPGGVAAVIVYGLFTVAPAVDAIIGAFHDDTVGPYWPRRRGHIRDMYRDLPFPFDRLPTPEFEMVAAWSLERVLGYLSTWSAVRRYMADRGGDPLDVVRGRLSNAWGPQATRTVRWPLIAWIGRHHESRRRAPPV